MADEEDRCACGTPTHEVSFAHYLSCGDDAPCTQDEAQDFQERIAARILAVLGSPCDLEDCAGHLHRGMAEQGIDITITTQPPLVHGPYTVAGFVCPHQVSYWMEPTGEQIAKWAKDGAR